jgi:hypothetical protein
MAKPAGCVKMRCASSGPTVCTTAGVIAEAWSVAELLIGTATWSISVDGAPKVTAKGMESRVAMVCLYFRADSIRGPHAVSNAA